MAAAARHRLARLPVTLRVIDSSRVPVLVEASLVDARGQWRRIVDKEAMFRTDGDPPGEGVIIALVTAERGDGDDRVLTVSLATPMGLADDRGEESIEVLAASLRQADTDEYG
jgi:hypothetical protein